MIRKHNFNMIEVVLALMVISIGVMSIMGLVPIGVKAHQDALSYNRAADLANDALHESAVDLQKNWAIRPDGHTWSYPERVTRPVYDADGNFMRTVVDYEVQITVTLETGLTGFYYNGTAITSGPIDNIRLLKAVATWPPGSSYPQEAHFALEVKKQ